MAYSRREQKEVDLAVGTLPLPLHHAAPVAKV